MIFGLPIIRENVRLNKATKVVFPKLLHLGIKSRKETNLPRFSPSPIPHCKVNILHKSSGAEKNLRLHHRRRDPKRYLFRAPEPLPWPACGGLPQHAGRWNRFLRPVICFHGHWGQIKSGIRSGMCKSPGRTAGRSPASTGSGSAGGARTEGAIDAPAGISHSVRSHIPMPSAGQNSG
jgi:hypothetical protein